MSDTPEKCPKCGKSFQGDPIPEEHRSTYYAGATHYSLCVGREIRGQDYVSSWFCPFCQYVWERDMGKE